MLKILGQICSYLKNITAWPKGPLIFSFSMLPHPVSGMPSGVNSGRNSWPRSPSPKPLSKDNTPNEKDPFFSRRSQMVKTQIEARGIKDPLVLKAMTHVQRHLFVPKEYVDSAYHDYPLPIGHGQTISQPYIVALMTELLELKGGERVLEIGTGSGYQTAVIAEIAAQVYSVEIVPDLAQQVGERLKALGYTNINLMTGNGYNGWPEEAPFEAIIITAAPEEMPKALLNQLALGGVMVVPVGSYFQDLYQIRKGKKGISSKNITSVRFVPMIGKDK